MKSLGRIFSLISLFCFLGCILMRDETMVESTKLIIIGTAFLILGFITKLRYEDH